MQLETDEYLATAERNRQFAEAALVDLELLPALRQWAAVAAFYSAVHYINAYLYEQRRFEPRNHSDRSTAIARSPELNVLVRDFQRLNDAGYRARYVPMHALPDARLRRLVEVHLRRIGDGVDALLNPDT
jgi:hypothetical protein